MKVSALTASLQRKNISKVHYAMTLSKPYYWYIMKPYERKHSKHDWWRKVHRNVLGSWSHQLETGRWEWHLQSIIYLKYQILHNCQISAINIYGWSTGRCIRNTTLTLWANHLPLQEKKDTYLIGYTILCKMIQNSRKMRQGNGKWGNRVCSLNITILQIYFPDLAQDNHPSSIRLCSDDTPIQTVSGYTY